ncbi:hypothetical protein IJU97_03220 [bacterium]|nr:hypothetical protein [bacterium]
MNEIISALEPSLITALEVLDVDVDTSAPSVIDNFAALTDVATTSLPLLSVPLALTLYVTSQV